MTNKVGGAFGGYRKGAIPHQQALSPPEVCVFHQNEGGSTLGCGQGNVKAITVQPSRQKQWTDLCNFFAISMTYYFILFSPIQFGIKCIRIFKKLY